MQEFSQIKEVIGTINIIIKAMKARQVGIEDVQNVQMTAAEINRVLYHFERLTFQKNYNLENEEDYQNFIMEIETLVGLWEQTMRKRTGKAGDVEFWDIYEFFKYVDASDIFQMVVQHFLNLPEGRRIDYLSLPYRYTFLQGRVIDFSNGNFSLIARHVELMTKEVEKYKWLYEHLADHRSKMVLNGIIRYWFKFDIDRLQALVETVFSDYYDLDILECNENDVLVDLGAYTGDSVLNYIGTYGRYKKIYAYEITPSTYQILVQNVSGHENVFALQKGVSSESGVMFVNDGEQKAGNKLLETGDYKVKVVTLDEDITEPITVIKMDIEGAEKDAILGAKNHIQSDRPRMLVSSYHLPEDIFEIPYLINSIREDYKFYMRFNGCGCLWPCDFVLFAV